MGNHKFGNIKIGIWSKDKGVTWGDDLNWNTNSKLNQSQHSYYSFAMCNKHSLMIECEDFIDYHQKLYVRKFTLQNETKQNQELSMFFKQDFEHEKGVAFFNLTNRALYHEYEGMYLLFNGLIDGKGISQYSTWQGDEFYKKNILNIENGSLLLNPIASGKVKSAFALETELLPYEIKHGYYWIAVGDDLNDINGLNGLVSSKPEAVVRKFIENDFYDEKVIPLTK